MLDASFTHEYKRQFTRENNVVCQQEQQLESQFVFDIPAFAISNE